MSTKPWFEPKPTQNSAASPEENVSFLGQMSSIQDNFTSQLQDLSGALPGPLSAEFRTRITNSIYLLAVSVLFAILTIVLGLPTLLVRPSKFVVCLTLSTIFAAASVIVMQKPSVFFASIVNGGVSVALPIILLGISMLITLYVTIFVHKYIHIMAAGAIQMGCLLFYLASFIPGGKDGLIVLLRTMFLVVSTAAQPFIFMARKFIAMVLSRIFS